MSDPLIRLREELDELKLDEKIKSLHKDLNQYIASQSESSGAKELEKMFREMNEGFKSGMPEKLISGFEGFKERISGFGIISEVFSPVLEIIGGLFEVFIGYVRGGMMESIQLMVDVLSSDSVMNAIGVFANLIGNILGPVIEGFADFLRLMLGDDTLTDAEVGRAIGTIIGGVIGAALASYVGMTWMGAIIGGWIGGMIGEWVGTTFGTSEPSTLTSPTTSNVSTPVALAEGGFVFSPTLTVLGENEPEVVIPMKKLEMIKSVEKSYLYEKILSLMIENNELMKMKMVMES